MEEPSEKKQRRSTMNPADATPAPIAAAWQSNGKLQAFGNAENAIKHSLGGHIRSQKKSF